MEKSIENIWKDGFLQSNALVAPKLNDLYNQKSKHVIDKFKRMFVINLIALAIAAILVWVMSFFAGVPIAGTVIALCLGILVVIGKRSLTDLKKIDTSASSYQYLKSFDSWLKDVMSVYARVYRFMYPLLFLAIMLGTWFSNIMEETRGHLLNETGIDQLLGMPFVAVVLLGICAALMMIFSDWLYKMDMKSVYGGVMNKLNELITDMEELRA